jgi:N-acetylglucosaminyldiphosphoundecaprenol N-acetyl-beta-D-mannosaminyltransferase
MFSNMPADNPAPPPRANVLGVGVTAVDMAQALNVSEHLLRRGGKGYICVTGVHGVMEALRDTAFRRILNRAFLCVPDGVPTVWMGHLQKHRQMKRVYGPDFMLALCSLLADRACRHFLYGGREGVAEKLKERLECLVPGIEIAGTYTPPFRPLNSSEEQELLSMVAGCKPDVFWVGLSTPKQERFMAQYIDRLDVQLMVGVGAAFDIHTGSLRDAPQWMKTCGLQWIHRLWQEPRRLTHRYLRNNPSFLWNVFTQMSGIRSFEIDSQETKG